MSLRVGDLYVELGLRGNLDQDLRRARQGVQDIDQAADRARQGLRDINIPGDINSRSREAEQSVGRIGNAANTVGNQLAGIGSRLGGSAGGELGGNFLSGFSEQVAGLGGKAGPIGIALAGVAALGLGAGAALMSAINEGMQAEVGRDKIQAQLGISEQEMAQIGKAAANAYTNAWGNSVGENMEGIRDAMQSGLIERGSSVSAMQPIIEDMNLVSELLGEELPRVSRSAGQLIKAGIATNAEEAFDILVKSTQNGLNVSEDLLDTVDEYSTKFRDLGLEGADAFALMAQAVKAGARDTDVAADALKEFQIRSTDGSKASAEAFELLNMNAEEMTAKFSEGGASAREGLDEVLDRLREMPPGIDRTTAAVGLFGTKAEDMGEALFAMDLSTAAQEFGKVAGAANEAATVMGDNAATKIEMAKRSIEVSMDGVKASLASAFGPQLGKIADAINTHKPEIIAFFVGLTDAALATGEHLARFAADSLRHFASLNEGIAFFIGGTIEGLGEMAKGVGSVIKHIPGLEGTGEAMESAGNAMTQYKDRAADAAGTMRDWADALDKGADNLGELREDVRQGGADAVASAEMFRALGDGVTAVPSAKGIVISDNTPESIQRLEALGLKVTTLPDGQVEVTADTQEGQEIIDAFIRNNNGKEVQMTLQIREQRIRATRDAGLNPDQGLIAGPVRMPDGTYRADGAVDLDSAVGRAPSEAVIKPDGAHVVHWAEKGTGGEAYIPLAPQKRERSTRILAETAKRFNLKLIEMADGGFDGEAALAKAKAHDGEPYVYGALDCSGYLSAVFNAGTGQNVRFVTGSDFEAMGWEPGYDPDGFSIGTDKGVGMNGHMAGSLFGTNIESDGSNGIQFGGTADGPNAFPYVYHWPGARGAYFPEGRELTDDEVSAAIRGASPLGGGGNPDGTGTTGGGASSSTRSSSSSGPVDVRVTNWPEGLGKTRDDEAKARMSLALYNGGGTVGGAGDEDSILAGLTPGEEVIRKSMAIKHRSLLKLINADALPAFNEGGTVGFGGYTDAGADYQRQWTIADLFAAASGTAFMIGSAFDSSGRFRGINTGSTELPVLEKAFADLVEKLGPNPRIVIEEMRVEATSPQDLAQKLTQINPATVQVTQKGMF